MRKVCLLLPGQGYFSLLVEQPCFTFSPKHMFECSSLPPFYYHSVIHLCRQINPMDGLLNVLLCDPFRLRYALILSKFADDAKWRKFWIILFRCIKRGTRLFWVQIHALSKRKQKQKVLKKNKYLIKNYLRKVKCLPEAKYSHLITLPSLRSISTGTVEGTRWCSLRHRAFQ